jgi:DNA polymerase-3 subunit alpha
MGHPALALTDHGTLSGALHHIKACRDNGLIPISGVEAYFRPDRSSRESRKAWHLCLFAKNLRGWHSLLRITSRAYEDNREGGGFYQYPCVDWELLEAHREGLIVSTACISGWLCHNIKLGDDVEADRYLTRMKKIFGDDLWIEIMPHDFPEQRMVNIEIANLATQHSIPIIATTDAHFPYKDWAETQQIAKLMSTKSSFQKEVKRSEENEDAEGFAALIPTAYLMSEKECRALFAQAHPNLPERIVDEAIKNTHELARSTQPFMLDKSDKLPKVSNSPEESEKILRGWCEEGLERIGRTDDQDYRDRYEFEFGVMKKKGVLDYFVLTGDVVRWARAQGIRTNVRGSAAGCLVSYLIGITHIDPIGWELLFERFLNPGRKGLPDIDLDFDALRRDEVKKYLADKFGQDHIADIIAHQTFQPKAVITDVARAFDVPFMEVRELNDSIDIRAEDEETTLEEIRPINEKLDKFAVKYPEVWKHALRLQGTVRNTSKHAAGVVITDRPVMDYMPLERGRKGEHVTSWSDRADFPAVSDHGLVKLDMLGIKGLTKQDVALMLIKERHDKEIDLDNLPVLRNPRDVDPKVMEIFTKGLTLGIWQFTGRGITSLMKQIKPDWGGDLAAANALYRPGPMGQGSTWEYADLKQMPDDEIVYWDESIRFALAQTFGIIAYQEQVMEICKALGGFTPSQADDMRKAMGKLYRLPGSEAQKFMSQFKGQWDKGTKSIGLDSEQSEMIWEKILSFGGYGFNKSHSVSYACQAYQDAFLKAYYPHEFYCALLWHPPATTQKNSDEKSKFMRAVYREADHLNVTIAPPDINTSGKNFSLDGDVLRFGLNSIKDVGLVAADAIVRKRWFADWRDFTKRVLPKECNAKVRAALIESGACDSWDMRADLSGQEIMRLEKERLGISLTMTGIVEQNQALIRQNIHEIDEFDSLAENEEVVIGGDVLNVSNTVVKKGKQAGMEMAFVDIVFGVNLWRCTLFPSVWDEYRRLIISGEPLMVAGKKNMWRGQAGVIVTAMTTVEDWIENVKAEEGQESHAS